MEKGYKNIVYFFLVISVIIFAGFYKSYFGLFPAFVAIKTIHHIHAFTLLLWLALLIIQPILIRQKKYKWHRILGKVSYVLVPLIFIFMLLVYKNQYLKGEINGDPHTQNLAILFSPVYRYGTLYHLLYPGNYKPQKHPKAHAIYDLYCNYYSRARFRKNFYRLVTS